MIHSALSPGSGAGLIAATRRPAMLWLLRIVMAAAAAGLAGAWPAEAAEPPAAGRAAEPRLDPGLAPIRFDLAVSRAPAAQVFMQLGQGTGYTLLVPPEVSGEMTLTLKDVTVVEVLDALRDLYGYDYRITGKRVVIQPNTVQTRIFRVNYLPGRRQGASDLRVTSSAITQAPAAGAATGTATPAAGGSGVGARSDDSAHVRTTSDADFWHEVQQTLVALIGSEDRRSVVLSPAAGVIVVRATPAELRQVGAYLEAMQLSIERQVMIEAKIIEVELNQDAQAGVNWAAFGNSLFGGNNRAVIGVGGAGVTLGVNGALSDANNTATPGSSVTVGASGKGFYGLAYQSPNFAALLNFLQTQGKAQVLSSPRIATLNNQKAVLKVGSDELYVTGISTTTTSSGTGSTSSPTVILQPFFSGIALDVTPQIDDDGHVILHVHPSVSTVTERTKNIDLGSLGAYRLPLAASTVNESDSIVRVGDGQIVAIGGLMQQSTHDDRNGVAGLSEVPVIGALFRQRSTTNGKHELVILMRPTVIRDGTAWPESDAGVPAVAPPEPAR